ncbi:isochorismatase [Sporothrix schenckii 1099-18]|uniref:Isochorismatase-like domain-containing protein n=2 Tax=Sporothrix schenckii TaxID=29908 RepID=U7Q6B7_SPOS1|nr:isochorismatase [Sporothrix schenckii 1099-18]ERT02747.1 hypothetical protein HMPREF1624_01049 [Sporothrix schenckii ATCC 58251]KJR79936.1 isochorismatase [Sporothrix schenckii 1099-18]
MADTNTRTALFVIDVQAEMARDPATQIPHADRVVKAGETILQAARRAITNGSASTSASSSSSKDTTPSLIVIVQHEEPNGTLLRGSDAWQLVLPPRLGVETEILVAKTTQDTFESNPDLAQRLRDLNIGRIVTCGIQSECCVLSTSRGALAAGFDVTLLSGAHSTYNDSGKTAVEIERGVEAELQAKGAHILPWEDVIKSWE